jgi:hypothetical protein
MRILIIFTAIIAPFISFAQNNSDNFVGVWNALDGKGKIKYISIKKVHDNYYLSFNTLPEMKKGEVVHDVIEIGSETYQLKDGSLFDEKNNKSVVVNKSTGHLIWHYTEWAKSEK